MNPRQILRAEGFAVFVAATGTYLFALEGALWLYLLLLFAPDLSMLVYLAGPRLGSYGYNLAHTYVAPVALAGAGLLFAVELALLVALVWAAHIGVDRSLAYGLKHATGFRDTHLGRAGRRGVDGDGPTVPMGD
jgi:hypothetical protein